MNHLESKIFPSNFTFGINFGAPHQIEGQSPQTDYSKLANQPPQLGWWNYPEFQETDFGLARDLSVQTARLGIEWARIFPKAGMIDKNSVSKYVETVSALRSTGIEPIITLHHFTLPDWIARSGGWANPRITSWFQEYVKLVVQDIAHDVPCITTINEPSVFLLNGYGKGEWPPHKRLSPQLLLAYANVVKAHNSAFATIKKINPSAQVGMSEVLRSFAPTHPAEQAEAATRHFLFNELMHRLTQKDFLGVNYFNVYTLKLSRHRKKPPAETPQPKDDKDIPISSQHFLTALKKLYQSIKKPILITENGVVDAQDRIRGYYIVSHLLAIHEAIKQGIPITGYNYWSLTDTYEWMEALGKSRFGLAAVDLQTMRKIPRRSYYLYRRICQGKVIDVDAITTEFLTEQERDYLNQTP